MLTNFENQWLKSTVFNKLILKVIKAITNAYPYDLYLLWLWFFHKYYEKTTMKHLSSKLKNIFVFALSLTITLKAKSQSNAFQVRMDTLHPFAFFHNIVANEQDEIMLLMDGANSILYDYFLVPINGNTVSSSAIRMTFSMHAPGIIHFGTKYYQDKLYFSALHGNTGLSGGRPVLTGINLSTGENWSKRYRGGIFNSTQSSIDCDPTGNIVLASGLATSDTIYPQQYVIEMFKFNPDGINLWKKALVLSNTGYSNGNLVGVSKIVAKTSGFIFLTGHLAKDNAHTDQGQQFIIKTDSLGHPVKWKIIKNFLFYDMIVTDEGIYLWDKNPSFFPLTVNQFGLDKTGTRLVKLDHDLNLQWAKRFSAENFSYFNASLTKTSGGNLIMSHATFGSFPAILTQLDQNGNIISQKGYPNFTPTITALSNGGLMLASPYTNIGSSSHTPVIAKTDANGDIPGCTTYQTCMEVEDFTVEFQNFQIDTVTAFDLVDLPAATVQPYTATFQPYCDYPPAPVPTFAFPDTLCLGDTAATVSEGNRLAQAREWHLTGPSVDVMLRDSFEFKYQFNLPGEYRLRQTIWVLGCATSHEHFITVLPQLTLAISGDSLVCPDEQSFLLAVANRPSDFLWSNGQMGQQPFVTSSGTYSVTATDGYCTTTDSTSITVVAELLGGNAPLTLPPDTTTCLPYDLVPQSQFSDLFFTDTDPAPRPSIRLEAAGSYRIGMMAFGCEFWDVYSYGVDCHVDVYLPTSFSPNGDGINDVFMPFGNLFELVEMRVYDRWGGLLHQGREWDGGIAGQGVYLYELSYLNLRSGLKEEVNGQVLLVK